MKHILLLSFALLITILFNSSCNKVEHPYPEVSDFDTTIYPGAWSEYETTIWPTFTVNTNTNRNVLIEDFTGHKCIFCPFAAELADSLEQANEGRIFVASLHTSPTGIGSFQELHEPLYTHDFTNPQGLEIGTYFGSLPGSAFVGNPYGSFSRLPINGQNVHNPNTWKSLTTSTLTANDLKVNIQGVLNYYDETKGFFLHTEVEKFASVTNDLAQVVYLIEDSIVKPQAFPGGVDSISYIHHNVHRGCIDGRAFGKTLTDADKDINGKYYVNYSYRIPSQYNPANMHVLVYVFDKVTMEIYHVIKLDIN